MHKDGSVRMVAQSKREDQKKSGLPENFSIHPWRNVETGRRQTYNVAGNAKKSA